MTAEEFINSTACRQKVADLINEGFIKSYDQMITYLKNVYRHKYLPAVFS